MGNPQERQAGTSGSTTGYGPEGARSEETRAGQTQPDERSGAETYRRDAGGRHATGERRGAVLTFTAVAGTLMLLSGLWSVIVGVSAVSSGHVYVHAPASGYTYLWTIRGWGWAEIILGIVVFAAGVCVFLGMAWARYLGAFLAVVSAIGNFMFIPFTPLWSIVVIILDAFIIWALLTPRQAVGQM